MRRTLAFSAAIVLMIVLSCMRSSGQEEVDGDKTQSFMRGKLVHSQQILEAMALEDYDSIARHAEQLRLLSLDASWQVFDTIEYVQLSKEFRKSASGLTEAAEEENIDGALLAYFQLTQNCVNCHKHVRHVTMGE